MEIQIDSVFDGLKRSREGLVHGAGSAMMAIPMSVGFIMWSYMHMPEPHCQAIEWRSMIDMTYRRTAGMMFSVAEAIRMAGNAARDSRDNMVVEGQYVIASRIDMEARMCISDHEMIIGAIERLINE